MCVVKEKIVLTLVKTVREILYKTTATAVGKIRLNSEYNKDKRDL